MHGGEYDPFLLDEFGEVPSLPKEEGRVFLNGCEKWDQYVDRFGFNKSPSDLGSNDLVGKLFDSIVDADIFYNLYSRAVGFSVRKGRREHRGPNGVTLRSWLCSAEGVRLKKHTQRVDRQREAKPETRFKCKAEMRVSYDSRLTKWIVTLFHTVHTHVLARNQQIRFLRSNRYFPGGATETANVLRNAGVNSAQIMSYMALLLGGYEKVPFSSKDLLNRMRRPVDLVESDASNCLGYLQHKADREAEFFGRYTFDNNNRLVNLFWADSRSRSDYKVFGDALAFDCTYRTNKYGKPLVVFVGINNHFRTTIFAFAVLEDETYDSYKWAVSTLIDCMEGKKPKTVITDGDLAMRRNIMELLPDTVHRLCTWHIEKNAVSNIKNTTFTKEFKKFFSHHFHRTDFEIHWSAMIKKFGLEGNSWVEKIFNEREHWGGAYFTSHFFGGMTTTQRCEGMNWMLKKKGTSKLSLVDFVRGVDVTLSWLRQKEAKDDYDSTMTTPVLDQTNMRSVERQCAEVYTGNIFFRVWAEIHKEGSYKVVKSNDCGPQIALTIGKYTNLDRIRQIVFTKETEFFDYDCYSYPTQGVPCRHVFCAIKEMNIAKLPESMILNRWTKKPRHIPPTELNDTMYEGTVFPTLQSARFGEISAKSSEIAFYASLNDEAYKIAKEGLTELSQKLHGSAIPLKPSGPGVRVASASQHVGVKNPSQARTKGEGILTGSKRKKQKACTNCKKKGHNKKTCVYRTPPNPCDDDVQQQYKATVNLDTYDEATKRNDATCSSFRPTTEEEGEILHRECRNEIVHLNGPPVTDTVLDTIFDRPTTIDDWLGTPF